MNYTEKDGPSGSCASTGQRYVTLTLGGIKAEGESQVAAVAARASDFGPDAQATEFARRAFLHVIADYLKDERAAEIEWRTKPEQYTEASFGGVWFIYWRARLAVTKRWPLEQAVA